MKKIAIISFALLLICGMISMIFIRPSQAIGIEKSKVSAVIIRGKIISIDTAKNEIAIKENKTGTEKTVAVDPKIISSLKIDEEVKVILKKGSNVAEKVKKITRPVTAAQKTGK